MRGARWILAVALLLALVTIGPTAASGGHFEDVVMTPYGTYNGIYFVKYAGRFLGGTIEGDYDVPFEIVSPHDPALSNGIVVVEVYHNGLVVGARDFYPGGDFIFGRRFMHAVVNWFPEGTNPFANTWVQDYSVEYAATIVADFVTALSQDSLAAGMVGDVERFYGTGVSMTCSVLAAVLDTEMAAGLFDFSLLNVPKWHGETHELRPDVGRVLTILSEADLINSKLHDLDTEQLRGSSDRYRCYEFAGSAHIPDNAVSRAAYGPFIAGTNPLDFTMSSRALFLAGHDWVTRGIEPPPSLEITSAPEGEVDAVYGIETGIARDEMGNALGGVRLPDLAVGRGQYVAVVPEAFFGLGLAGTFVDMKCDLLPDESPRFPSQGAYLSQFAQVAEDLVAQGMLLQPDADALIAQAAESELCLHNRVHLPALVRPAE